MYQLMIVDDESKIRRGLSKFIDWESLGCSVMDTATNGDEAIKKIEEREPHIILTDIRMPLVNGLELAQYIHENKPNIQVIILTGFADFEYSRKAIAYNVVDFVLKPTTPDTIKVAVGKAIERLGRQEQVNKQLHLLEEEKSRANERIFDYLLYQGMKGLPVEEDAIRQGMPQYLQPLFESYAFLLIELEDKGVGDQVDGQQCHQLEKYIQDILQDRLYYCIVEDKRLMGLFLARGHMELLEDMKPECMELRETSQMFYGQDMTIGISGWHQGISQMSTAYVEARKAIGYAFYKKGEQVYIYSDHEQVVMALAVSDSQIEYLETLEEAMEVGNHEGVYEGIHGLYTQLGQDRIDPKTIQSYSIWLYALLMNKLPNKVNWKVKKDHIKTLSHMKHKEQLEAFIMKCYKEQMDKKQGSYDNYLVDLVNDYIAKHYKEHISLSSISKSLSVNHSYLSRLYKKVTSQNLTTAITKYRIDKATELLQGTDMKVYQIANAVGIEDATYFSQLFKKYTSTNPSDYR